MLLKNYKKKHSFISYSQSGEDLIIKFIFNHILKQEKFNYFDVGANHPYHLSNTALFYDLGMNGVVIEPNFILCKELLKYRKRDKVLNIGVSSSNVQNQMLNFYRFNVDTISTFSEEEATRLSKMNHYKIIDVKQIEVLCLNELFEKYFLPDFISIDVEGSDFDIIRSIDFNVFRPKVMCVETSIHGGEKMGSKDFEIIDYLVKKNYINYGDTFNNTIFLDSKLIDQL